MPGVLADPSVSLDSTDNGQDWCVPVSFVIDWAHKLAKGDWSMPIGRLYFGSLASIVLSVALSCPGVIAQSKEKPKLKDFGKSLKRLKWDPKLNQAVATKTKSDRSKPDEDDVVRVETN